MFVKQFVMAYEGEQDRLRALLPEGFSSLRPVLRINGELVDGVPRLEFNTPVERDGKRGWLNIAHWEAGSADLSVRCRGEEVTFLLPWLEITFTPEGREGGCPAEKDNDGCFFLGPPLRLRVSEPITVNKEYCRCAFAWKYAPGDARGESTGVTLPAFWTPPEREYERGAFTAPNFAAIPCRQVLGAYVVRFDRTEQ